MLSLVLVREFDFVTKAKFISDAKLLVFIVVPAIFSSLCRDNLEPQPARAYKFEKRTLNVYESEANASKIRSPVRALHAISRHLLLHYKFSRSFLSCGVY